MLERPAPVTKRINEDIDRSHFVRDSYINPNSNNNSSNNNNNNNQNNNDDNNDRD